MKKFIYKCILLMMIISLLCVSCTPKSTYDINVGKDSGTQGDNQSDLNPSCSDANNSGAETEDGRKTDTIGNTEGGAETEDGRKTDTTGNTEGSAETGDGRKTDATGNTEGSAETEDSRKTDATGETVMPTGDIAGVNSTADNDIVGDYIARINEGFVPKLIISEAVSSNSKSAPLDNEYYDWAELYNASNEVLSLNGYSFSDKADKPVKYMLPDITLKPGEYYIVYCTGEDAEGNAPFKISADGESLYLFNNGELEDYLDIPSDLPKNSSYGRSNGENVYMDKVTPGKKNKKGYDHITEAPVSDIPSGVYYGELQVRLTGEGTIYYTLDGSRPDKSSQVYTEPIVPDGVATTIRAFCECNGKSSNIVSFTYLIDVEHTLPIVNVSIPQEYLRGEDGILDCISQSIEKEAVITLIEDGDEKFSIPCGFRLHGNDSRKGAKQNFQIRFRSKYGAGKLHYKLFDNLDIDEFNSLLLKGGSEDYVFAMMRDELCTGIVNGTTELSVLECKPCVLYLGGQYWGIYFIRERFSSDYVASHFDVSKESVDLLYTMGVPQDGSSKDYDSLVHYINTHDLSDEECYRYVTDRVEITSLMDWYICRSYFGDKDYANIRYFKSSEYDNKWRYMFFDLDWSFWSSKDTPVTGILGNTKLNVVIYNLMKNKDFQDKFIRRYSELMGTILNEEYITAELDRYVEFMSPEMPADRERWGYSVSRWNSEVQKIYNILKDHGRTKNVLADIKNHFKLSDDEMRDYFPNYE